MIVSINEGMRKLARGIPRAPQATPN